MLNNTNTLSSYLDDIYLHLSNMYSSLLLKHKITLILTTSVHLYEYITDPFYSDHRSMDPERLMEESFAILPTMSSVYQPGI